MKANDSELNLPPITYLVRPAPLCWLFGRRVALEHCPVAVSLTTKPETMETMATGRPPARPPLPPELLPSSLHRAIAAALPRARTSTQGRSGACVWEGGGRMMVRHLIDQGECSSLWDTTSAAPACLRSRGGSKGLFFFKYGIVP